MDPSLRDRFARLRPICAVDRVTSGSPAIFVLRLPLDGGRPSTIDATHALARRCMTMLRPKRAVEALVENGRVFVEVPAVEDVKALTDDLARAGIAGAWIQPDPTVPDPTVNVRELRERLRLTREQFAIRYGLGVETVCNRETGKREPDTTSRSYLRAISNAPRSVEHAYASALKSAGADIWAAIKDISNGLPITTHIDIRGQSEVIEASFRSLGWAIFPAMILVYALLVVPDRTVHDH